GFLLFVAPLLGFALSRSRLTLGLLFVVLAVVGTWALDFALFRQGYVVHSALAYLEIVAVVLAAYILLYFRVYKEWKRLRHTRGHYLAPAVLEEVLKDQRKLKLGGEKRELTVMFSDIRGFTKMAESFDA